MDTRKDNSDVVIHAEALFAEVQLSPLQQATEKVRQAYSGDPIAPVVPIEKSPIYRPPAEESELDTVPVPLTAEGEPTDMRQYRALKAARQEIAEIHAEMAEIPPNDTA